MKLLSIYVHS